MTAQSCLKAALRDVLGPAARSHGFKGSAPTWRRSNDAGDWALVNVQSSSLSTANRISCVINISVAPEPWLRWSAVKLGSGMPKTMTENLGMYRDRLHPDGTPTDRHGWWEITDEHSAHLAVDDMLHQLDVGGWPLLSRLLEPGAMLEQVRRKNLGHMKGAGMAVFFARAEAILLMDAGLTPELEKALQFALGNCIPTQREHAKKLDAWIREQAFAPI